MTESTRAEFKRELARRGFAGITYLAAIVVFGIRRLTLTDADGVHPSDGSDIAVSLNGSL